MQKIIKIKGQELRNIDEGIFITGQIFEDMMQEIKNENFCMIINNRPDYEEINQIKNEDLKYLAESLGVNYYSIPFSGNNLQNNQIKEFANLVQDYDKKALIFCRSGARSSLIWGLASIMYLGVNEDEVIKKITNIGYDASIIPKMVEHFS